MREVPAPLAMTSRMRSGVEPGLGAEHDRLGGGGVVHRDQQIGDEFHPAAVAELAEIVADPGEGGEGNSRHRAYAASSPLPYSARSRVRACAPVPDSGQSSSVMPAAREPVVRHLLRLDRKGAEFGDDAPGMRRGDEARRPWRPARRRSAGWSVRRPHPRAASAAEAAGHAADRPQRRQPRRIDIEAADREPGSDQVRARSPTP